MCTCVWALLNLTFQHSVLPYCVVAKWARQKNMLPDNTAFFFARALRVRTPSVLMQWSHLNEWLCCVFSCSTNVHLNRALAPEFDWLLSSSSVDVDVFFLSSGEKAPPPLLRWLFGINRTLWRSTSPIPSARPGLPAPPPPTNQNTAPCALAAAHWLSLGEGEWADTTPSASPSLRAILFLYTHWTSVM